MVDNRPYVELEFTGTTLTQDTSNTLIGNDIVIDYGDGTTVNYNGDFSHTYNSSGDYTIRIYGVTSLGNYCFSYCSGLTSVVIPNSVTSLGDYCFAFSHGLTSVRLNWTSTNDIISYRSDWFANANNNLEFIVPIGTASLYETKGYPSNKLYELPPLTHPSLSIGGKKVKSLSLLGKKVKSLTRVSDGTVLYHTPLWLEAESDILQSTDTTDVYANVCSGRGHLIHFFERLTPVFRLTAEPSIIEVGEPTDIYTTVKDSDGSKIKTGTKVHFYKDTDLSQMLFVSADKQILSYADNENTVITAKLYGADVSGQTITFKQGNTVLDTVLTDGNGEATYEYSSTGVGDVTITVECENITETITIEDCIYYNETEKIRTGTYAHSLYDTNLSVTLPTNAEISFDCYVADNNNYDYRYWLMPKSQFTGNTNYPNYAPSYCDRRTDTIATGKRENGTSTSKGSYSLASSNYATIKYVKNGTSWSVYADGTLCYTETLSWIDNYTDYTLSMMKWSGNKTMYMKNVKFKTL